MSAPAIFDSSHEQMASNTGAQLTELLLRAEIIDEKALDRAIRVFSKLDTETTLFSVLLKMGLTDERDHARHYQAVATSHQDR